MKKKTEMKADRLVFLYVKTHIKTGLKYLGKTNRNPFIYKGSGLHWKRHIHKHGNDVWTNILFQSVNEDDVRAMGLYYSDLWNIVESEEWANIRPETGDGGFGPVWKDKKRSDESREKMSKAKKGKYKGSENPNYENYWSDEKRMELSAKRIANGKSKGTKNPMFGTKRPDLVEKNKVPKYWINNGIINKQIPRTQLNEYVEQGFVRGRL